MSSMSQCGGAAPHCGATPHCGGDATHCGTTPPYDGIARQNFAALPCVAFVTDRGHLSPPTAESLLSRVRLLADARPSAIILRDKELSDGEYLNLAERAVKICEESKTPCILHSHPAAAIALGSKAVHLPLPILRELGSGQRAAFRAVGTSCHSADDAREAEALGCTYIVAGHVFDTDCKKGLPGRGLPFLEGVCSSVSIPVLAIGGITPERMGDVLAAGAAGACVMGAAMECGDAAALLAALRGG